MSYRQTALATLSLAILLFAVDFRVNGQSTLYNFHHGIERTGSGSRADLPFDERLAPFYHGVASGDPTPDGVIIWTRVTPDPDQTVTVDWEVATDTGFSSIVQSGTVSTDSVVDYTVKVEVSGLSEGTTYYYRFEALSAKSLVGRTRTADTDGSQLRFIIVSCNNYQSGWFNAFGRISERNDIDAVIHLGDFIYEYEPGGYGLGDSIGRGDLEPEWELIELADYRLRYNWYRLDTEMRRAMQQHPFIFVWDDHETANDSWTGGAENHDTLTEGDWETRKSNGKKAWFEWAPVREHPTQQIYRTFDYGSLASLTMLDTRLEGRWKQADSIEDPSLHDPNRSILGDNQFDWVVDQLKTSTAQWKLLGNQVVFTPLLLADFEVVYPGAQNAFLDVWNGYPAERTRLMDSIAAASIDDIVFLTGDVHASFGFDVAPNPGDSLEYDPSTGMGSIAVEFVGPSISSDNFDENIGLFLTNLFEDIFGDYNPHNAYIDLDRHGYYVLDLTPAKAQADYFFAEDVRNPNPNEAFDMGIYTNAGENHLQRTSTPAPGRPVQEIPAPDPTLATALGEVPVGLMVMAAYPNPFSERIHLGFSLTGAESVTVRLLDMNGRVVAALYDGDLAPGTYRLDAEVPSLPAGSYLLDVAAGSQHSGRVMVRR